MKKQFDNVLKRAATLLAGLGLLICAEAACAAPISYSLNLAEDLNVLRHPGNANVAQNAAMKSQHVLMLERTNPFIELMNTSDDDALITQFTMTIGDASKNFDWGKFVEASPGVTFSLQMPDSVAGGDQTDLLTIHFTGFGRGEFVRFRLGLSPDDSGASAIMDYRNVLFRMNGGSDTSNNSTVNVSFSSGDSTAVLTDQLPNFVNNNKFTSTNLALLTTTCGMDSVMPFNLDGSGNFPQGPPEEIPEPGSIVLWGIGLAGLCLCAWRRRRRVA